MSIDPDAPEHPYQQIAAIITARIEDGTYERRIPTRSDLEAEFGVGPMTVARAVRLLSERGLVRTVPGRGTFVIRS